MKKYFIALWLLAVCASGLALWTAINGSPVLSDTGARSDFPLFVKKLRWDANVG